ncbi:Fc.00g029940.m01.CDS01 [Cosmosporella sp. VM-42]
MASFGRQFSPSPVLTMAPQPPHQSLGMANFTRHAPPRSFGSGPMQFASTQPTRLVTSSRKRSRDEAADNLEPDAVPSSPEDSEGEWQYGPGMVLIKPSSRYVTEAASQSGTWLEEKRAAEEATRCALKDQRPVLRCSKSQRTGLNPDASPTSISPANPSPSNADLKTTCTEASHDEFTLHLGIGWKRISDDVDIQAAARGWARFIENHYAMSNARILLESKGLQSYLVEATEGFFLFAENLRQGQLVSQNVQGALRNLQTSPPTFDGCETLVAAESPKHVDVHPEGLLADTEMHMD